jgi:NitT/TauT family transport system permease protein
VILIFTYTHFSNERLKENSNDKILPPISKMYDSMQRYITPLERARGNEEIGDIKLLEDVKASLFTLLTALGLSLLVAILFGVLLGTYPLLNAIFMPTINLLSLIPPAATVPLLFVAFDTGYELSVVIIFIFVFFVFVKDIVHQLSQIPSNLSVLLFTKGASELEIAKENFKMIIPGILTSLKLNLPMAWVGLYFAETLGSQEGLGYRTFILKRFMAHDVIIPYIIVVTLIAIVLYYLIELLISKRYPWYNKVVS